MNKSKKVSVIITSYNQKKYLKEALESVLNQTVLPYEILIPDDCSTDGSVEMIIKYEKKYPKIIRGIYNKKNQGIPKNRNTALEVVKGDYVYILDGDDKFLSNNIEVCLNFLSKNPHFKAIYSNLNFISANGKFLHIKDKKEHSMGNILFDIAIGRFGILRNMLIEYNILKEVGFMDERLPRYDGFDLTVRLAERCKIGYVKEPLAEYRVYSDTSDSKGLKPIDHLKDLERIKKKMKGIQKKFNMDQKNKFNKVWKKRLIRYLIMDIIENQKYISRFFLPLIVLIKKYSYLDSAFKSINMTCQELEKK